MSLFSADDTQRKGMPIFKMITGYFPKALREITRVCVANNVRYSPDRDPFDIKWARGKSPDQLGSLLRHMMERQVDGKVFETVSKEVTEATGIEEVYVLAEAAWRALAALELEIEQQENDEDEELDWDWKPLGLGQLTPAEIADLSQPKVMKSGVECSVDDGQFPIKFPPGPLQLSYPLTNRAAYEYICGVSGCPGHDVGAGGCPGYENKHSRVVGYTSFSGWRLRSTPT